VPTAAVPTSTIGAHSARSTFGARLRRSLKAPRKLTFTRLGRWYCALTLFIGLAAINTGNNLLFLVLGLMLSSIVVSGILSEISLRGVHVERRLPATATAGEEALVSVVATNRKRRAPSFSLELREKDGDIGGRAYVLMLAPCETHEVAYHFVPQRRGKHRLASLEVATRWPFGLFEKTREIELPEELVVFPRRVEPPVDAQATSGRFGERPDGRVGVGLEVHALRDHRPGEDVRTVHWRTSARAGKLIAIEREEERRRQVCVLLDHRRLEGRPLDSAVEVAAALVERELAAGADVALALCGQTLPARSGAGHLRGALTALALVGRSAGPAPVPPPNMAVLRVGRGEAA
jgi:uncharacterized protein (DUF58 family)